MLENVVTPVPVKLAPEASFADPESPVLETRVRTPLLVVAPPNGVPVAASAAPVRTAASPMTAASVMGRLMEPPLVRARAGLPGPDPHREPSLAGAAPPRVRTKSLRGAGDRRDVRGDVLDLLFGELTGERRHDALAVRDTVDDEGRRRLRLVEVRPDRARRPGVGERVARRTARRLEHLLAGGRVSRGRRGGRRLTASSTGGRRRDLTRGLGLDLLRLCRPHHRCHLREEEDGRHDDVCVEPPREARAPLGHEDRRDDRPGDEGDRDDQRDGLPEAGERRDEHREDATTDVRAARQGAFPLQTE